MSIVSVAVPSIVGVTILSFVVGLFLWLRQSKRKRLSMNDSYVPATEFMSLQKFEKSDERRKCSVQEVLKLRSSKLSTLQINVPHFPIDQIKYIQSLGQGNFGQVPCNNFSFLLFLNKNSYYAVIYSHCRLL
jgi:hypothetical protein